MKVKTITCHEVYNHGASLQEYALLKYLEGLGHEAQTIHYKPNYLSNHFNLWRVSTSRYNKNIVLKAGYLLAKLPGRLKILKRKKNFDQFSDKYIKSTKKLYKTNDDLKAHVPDADAYICGSDQIWNSFFENGKDPAFYLDFVPQEKLKISYAASFAIDQLEESIKDFVKQKVSAIDYVSVREPSGKKILADLGIDEVTHVLDPVFLLDAGHWSSLSLKAIHENYIFVYDCDSDPLIERFINKMKKQLNCKVVTVNDNVSYADANHYLDGPETFLSLLKHASFVVSNSFHAVAFSVIFEKQFTVFNRSEKINTRMRDFVNIMGIDPVLVKNKEEVDEFNFVIDYKNKVNDKVEQLKKISKGFLDKALSS